MLPLCILALGLLATIEAAKFPKKWTSCSKSDPKNMDECLRTAIEAAVHDLVNGNPSLGVLPLDPLHFDKILIDQGTGPVSIMLEFIDLDSEGLQSLKILKVVNDDWKKMLIKAKIDQKVVLKGKYKINGKVLILPIKGEGDCLLGILGMRGNATLKYSDFENGGKKYKRLDEFDFKFDADKLEIKLENLFNGDKALGDNMNVFLNENWSEILNELKPSIAKAFGAAFKEIGNRIFSKIPKDAFTPAQ